MTPTSSASIPWWLPSFPAIAAPAVTWRDYWDALFGRHETFYKIELDGSWCMVESQEVPTWLAPDIGEDDEYTITPVRLTRRQFEALPEFAGF